MNSRGLRVLPVLMVAVLALVLGSVGTAAAGGLTRHAVKKIAAKVVKKAAPTLSVAHAKTADHATTADSAGTLSGPGAAAFQPRAAFAAGGEVDTSQADPNNVVPVPVVGPVALTVPGGQHFVHLTSTAQYFADDFTSSGDLVEYWAVDAGCDDTTGFDVSPVFDSVADNSVNTPQSSVALEFTFNVTPGPHTFTVCGASDADIVVGNSTLTVQTVALNGGGGASGPSMAPKHHTTLALHR